MLSITSGIEKLNHIGERRAQAFKSLKVNTVGDILRFFPRDYEDRTTVKDICEIEDGEKVCVVAKAIRKATTARIKRNLEISKIDVFDETGKIGITFFNRKYAANSIEPGRDYIFFEKVDVSGSKKEMKNPIFEPADKKDGKTCGIVPIYRLTAGLTQNLIADAVKQALEHCESEITDPIPAEIREKYNLIDAKAAYKSIHFPTNGKTLETARRRMIFEELYVLSIGLNLLKSRRIEKRGICFSYADLDDFKRLLPYELTNAQKRSIEQVMDDMCSGRPMCRLVQGDVGSGKTMVAAAAAWTAAENGFQTAVMAPTEILAEQHFNTFSSIFCKTDIEVVLLTGSMGAKEKRAALQRIKDGSAKIIVGTHALISEQTIFNALGLMIADEQHRFGVEQRAKLAQKGINPHVLVMSATPIPRTLALMLYGDLDLSVIDEMPPGRQKVDTHIITDRLRSRLNDFIREQASQGRQIFVVCPAVEENEELDITSAEEHAGRLSETFANELKVGCVHGKMKTDERENVMSSFVAGDIDVLVATTVIEVGVDVPNATLMIVEDADRFGLSQLHQLRGRVGRGKHKSYCILVSKVRGGAAAERLKVLKDTDDGFKISQEDLRLRGPGDFFGSRQHGLPEFRIADLSYDMDIMEDAAQAAADTVKKLSAHNGAESRELSETILKMFSDESLFN